jgi:hypothetical protein
VLKKCKKCRCTDKRRFAELWSSVCVLLEGTYGRGPLELGGQRRLERALSSDSTVVTVNWFAELLVLFLTMIDAKAFQSCSWREDERRRKKSRCHPESERVSLQIP